VLLLDEPTAGMSPEERHEIFELVGTIRDEGVTVVVVEHDVESIVRYSDRVVALSFGEVLAVGAPEDVIAKEAVIDAYIGHGTRS
jgi:ABC-type branched-subunit amino acid transport system ATPase component